MMDFASLNNSGNNGNNHVPIPNKYSANFEFSIAEIKKLANGNFTTKTNSAPKIIAPSTKPKTKPEILFIIFKNGIIDKILNILFKI